MASAHLILGGARSGKSHLAVSSQPRGARLVFVATARGDDADMARRIARHRAERPAGWRTVEEPTALAATLKRLVGQAEAVVVDCLTLWVSNRLLGGDSDESVLAEAGEIAGLARGGHWDLTLVSNEVGLGVHPETAGGLHFRDLLGLVNQRVAAACDRVTLMVAGLPLILKSPGRSHDIAPEAP